MQIRTRTMLAGSLWLAAFGCCAAGLLVTLAVTRPLTIGVLADGAAYALAFPLGYATIGLVLALRRPANPIGWLYAASGLLWALVVPMRPWINQLADVGRPLPLAAKLGAAFGEYTWAPAIALGVTLPFLLLPDGCLRSRRWRVVVVASLAGSTMALVGGGLSPTPLTETPMDNPIALAGGPARSPRWSATSARCCTRRACRWRWSAWCCGSEHRAGSNASSCAGSPPGPPAPWSGSWRGPSCRSRP
jgi:hypothetical protein